MKEKIKKIAHIVLRVFLCIVRVSYCIIPFLYKLIPLVYAYIIWGVLAVIFIVAEIILWIVNRNKALDKTTNICRRYPKKHTDDPIRKRSIYPFHHS